MPLDSYSLCPGGRGKKIRHCCPDLLKDLQQLETMLLNGQYAAAANKVEGLRKDHPDCACLREFQCVALRGTGNIQAFCAAAKEFAAVESANPQALSQGALATAAEGDVVGGLSMLIDAFELSEPGTVHSSLFAPAMTIAPLLAEFGHLYSAVALTKILRDFVPDNPETAQLLRQLYMQGELPILFRDYTFDKSSPEDWLGTARYNTALSEMALGHWKKARTHLEELLEYASQWPNLWRTLAVVRFWLCDDLGARDALMNFARSEGVALEDAADAETILSFYADESDTVDVLQQTYEIKDDSQALESFLSDRHFLAIPFDPRQFGDAEHPAPSHIFRVLDKPLPPDSERTTLANTPISLGTVLFFGRQTDRGARVELQVVSLNQETLVQRVSAVAGDNWGEPSDSITASTIPWLTFKLAPEYQFSRTRMPDLADLEALSKDYLRERFIPEWLERPSADLDGKSPAQAASDGMAASRLMAAIAIVQMMDRTHNGEFLSGELRQKLNLPASEPLTAPAGDREAMAYMTDLPVWRWDRVVASSISPAVAGQFLPAALMLRNLKAANLFAERVISEPVSENTTQEEAQNRLRAYTALLERAAVDQSDQLQSLFDRAYEDAKAMKVSDASIHLRELFIRFTSGDSVRFQQTLRHLVENHQNEPGVMEALQMSLVQFGILNPDGTPRVPGAGAASPQGVASPVAPVSPSEEPSSGLWTPGSDTPAGGGGGSKLWIPD